ncbi:MAG: hypothetical protein ACK4UN_01705 [Limisphaerales bacterium]
MSNASDRLGSAKARVIQEIDARLELIKKAQMEIGVLKKKLLAIQEVEAISDSEDNLFGLIEKPKPAILIGRANANGLTDEAAKALSFFGVEGATPAEIRDHLIENGFKPSGTNFTISVANTLQRLSKDPSRRIERVECPDGKTRYRALQERTKSLLEN